MNTRSFYTKRIVLYAILCIFIVTVSMLLGIYARYTSERTAAGSVRAGRFVISATPGADDKDLVLVPSADGSYASYEFFVSNKEGSAVSDVAQFYNIRISIPVEAGQMFSDVLVSKGLTIYPLLVRTNNTRYTIDELIYFTRHPDEKPDSVQIEVYGVPDEEHPDGNFKDYEKDEETMQFTWCEDDGTTPVSFAFEASAAAQNRHFIVFYVVGGTLDESEMYSLGNIQIIAYSEQIPPTN